MLRGLLVTVFSLQLLVFGNSLVTLVLSLPLLVFGLGLALNSVLPLVVNLISGAHSGLGMGMYFGSTLAAFSIFDWGAMSWGAVNPVVGALGGGVALLSAYTCARWSKAKLLTYS